MNFSAEESEATDGVLFVDFNQAATSLCVGTKNGYKIYDLHDIDHFSPIYEFYTDEGIYIVEKHFLSGLIGVVSLASPRKLSFYNFSTKSMIDTIHFPNTILSLKLNRKTFVVCMEENLQIRNILEIHSSYTIKNIPQNPNGLCALSAENEKGFVAYPGSSTVGDVQIFDVNTSQAKISIPAHGSPVIALAFNLHGTMLATASIKGTVIRVFNTTSGQNLFEFRRGYTRYVTIYSLSFDVSSDLLCASSNTETVHIFKLSTVEEEPSETRGWLNMFGSFLTKTVDYLPYQVSEILNKQRAFSYIHLPVPGLKTICRITEIQNVPYVVLVSSDGFLYMHSMVAETSVYTLAKQHRLDGHVSMESCASAAAINHKESCASAASLNPKIVRLDVPEFRKSLTHQNHEQVSSSSPLSANYNRLSCDLSCYPETEEGKLSSSS